MPIRNLTANASNYDISQTVLPKKWQSRDQPTQMSLSNVSIISDEIIGNRFSKRNELTKKICSKPFGKITNGTKKKSEFGYKQLLVCQIAKVGTAFLEYLNYDVFVNDKSYSVSSNKSKSFVLVREPYSRMVSGYIEKIVISQPWWTALGKHIIRKFRLNATDKEKMCGNDVSFPELVKYFIHAQKTGWIKNEHFTPMHEVCNPCEDSYDFIAHLETLKDDLSFILKSANISTNIDFSDEELTMRDKAKAIISQKKEITRCESMCSALRKVWWSFHARGLISRDIEFTLHDDQCDTISGDEFADISWNAHVKSVGHIDKSKQKRETLIELFLQVPLEDRIQIRDLLSLDFQLFGYESQPDDLFPELAKSQKP